MTDDIIARLIAGPGSRELDYAVFVSIRPGYRLAKGPLGGIALSKNGQCALDHVPEYTTSIDAAVAFAVAVAGAERAAKLFCDVQALAREGKGLAYWFDDLPRCFVAEVLKARGDD